MLEVERHAGTKAGTRTREKREKERRSGESNERGD